MKRAAGSRSMLGQCFDLVSLRLLLNVAPRDYYFFEFYRGDRTRAEIARYASVRGSRYWIFGNNPFKYQILFTDKYVQKNLFAGLGLPTPRLIALLGAGGTVSSLETFRDVLDGAPDEFVLKPVSSRGGHGFRRITKRNGTLLEGSDPVRADELWSGLQDYLDRGVLVEETAHNCDVIGRMNPSSLNTFRVITFRFPERGWQVICVNLKVGRQDSAVDNSGAGGLAVSIDDDGVTGQAIDFSTHTRHSHHPDSGTVLAGVQIDGFRSVVDLAVAGSRHFSQMGILGWDIALTDEGPVIIEVNASPACEYPQVMYGGIVTDEMARVLKPRHLFSRYDKRFMYPNHFVDRRGRV